MQAYLFKVSNIFLKNENKLVFLRKISVEVNFFLRKMDYVHKKTPQRE